MIEFLVAVVAFVFSLGLLVTLHEFGHFYFAKKAGILCSEFAIGMGPVIYRVKKGETYYSIRALPIGGYVSMAGEDLNENLVKIDSEISLQLDNNLVTEIIFDNKIDGVVKGIVTSVDMYGKDGSELYVELNVNNEICKYNIADECYYVMSQSQKMRVAPYDRCFESKTLMERFLTLVAGPVMNLILAVFLFLIVGLASGVPTNENIIGSVTTNTAQLYLEENDEIIKIGNYEITNWADIGTAMNKLEAQRFEYIPMTILRDGETIEVEVKSTIQILAVGLTNLNNEDENFSYSGDGVVLGEIPSGNKASEVGLKKMDVLTNVTIDNENYEINSWGELMDLFEETNNSKVSFTYFRDGKESTTKEIEIFSTETLISLGVSPISYTIGITATTEFSFVGGIVNGFKYTWSNATMIFTTLGMVLNPSSQLGVSDLSGPVGIFALVQSYVDAGIISFLSLIGMLSINFFVVNLLPFPALDGGRIAFLGYEAITKKPVDKKLENTLTLVGFALLMILMIYVTFNDLLRL